MKYQSHVDKIAAGVYGRAQLVQVRKNAADKVAKGDLEAQVVIDAIDQAQPNDARIVFMGFCPSSSVENRLDIEWRAKGICTFIFFESEHQLERFNDIWVGELIVLKKRQVIGKTMRLYGHGRVTGVEYDDQEKRFLRMAWSTQDEVIEVPLMAANATVEPRDMAAVEREMPDAFWSWLKVGADSSAHKKPPDESEA